MVKEELDLVQVKQKKFQKQFVRHLKRQKKQMVRIPLREGRTIHHDIKAKFSSSTVILRSAPKGTGIISGGPSRAIFEALGISDVVSKAIGTKNPHNIVRSTIKALRNESIHPNLYLQEEV